MKTFLLLFMLMVNCVTQAADGLISWQFPAFKTPVANVNIRIYSTNKLVPPPWPLLLSTNVSTTMTNLSLPMTNDMGLFYADCYYTPLIAGTNETNSSVTLAWNPPADATVVGYKVYWGTNASFYTNSIDARSNLFAVISGLRTNVNYAFVATAYNSNRVESDFSSPPLRYQLGSPITNYVPVTFSFALNNGPRPTGSKVGAPVKRPRVFVAPPPAPLPPMSTNIFRPKAKKTQ